MKTLTKKPKRPVHGILLLDKPLGISSNRALQKTKYLYQAAKAGHTGSLDPLATGMLPLCFGQATKFSQYLLDANKSYWVQIKLGIRTETADSEGKILSSKPVPAYTQDEINQSLDNFRGEIQQVPPMFSALKQNGKPLYQLARAGIVLERKPRTVTINQIEILGYQDECLNLQVECSKGTYIRSLADDLGENLGCGAHVQQLRRLTVGKFLEHQMITMNALESIAEKENLADLDGFLLPLETIFREFPALELNSSMLFYLQNGKMIDAPANFTPGLTQLLDNNGRFLGIAEISVDGKVYVRRLLRTSH
jgi:tRNA pseudouridine55 synthase